MSIESNKAIVRRYFEEVVDKSKQLPCNDIFLPLSKRLRR